MIAHVVSQPEDVRPVEPVSSTCPPARPVPVYFGAPGRAIAGVFHPSRATVVRNVVVVLFGAIGWEGLASQRAWWQLAELLATVGFHVLRFDYLGTADSSALEAGLDCPRAWLESAQLAIAEAQRLSGCSQVSLVGLHLGATLAVRTALEQGGAASLVLWAPYTKGRAFVREAKAYSALNDTGTSSPRPDLRGGVEAAGFLLSARALDQLSALDLLADPRPPAPNALLLGRSSGGSELPLLKHLSAAGVQVTHGVSAGFKDLMQEPRKSRIPHEDFDVIARYLDALHPSGEALRDEPISRTRTIDPSVLEPHTASMEMDAGDVRLRETALCFGPDARLFGILTEPADQASTGPVALFLTTASHHRTGPNGMYVPVARELARRGFASFRFDLTGVGDSLTSPEIDPANIYSKAFIQDVVAALDLLQERLGRAQFLTIGLCSGAYLAFHSGLTDARVVGMILINPQSFNWRDGDSLDISNQSSIKGTRFYTRAVLSPNTWLRGVRGQINVRTISRVLLERIKERAIVEAKRALNALGLAEGGFVDIGDAFQKLTARGARLYLVYGADDQGLDYLQAQVGSRLNRLLRNPNFQMDVVEGPDHTFSQLWAQAKLRALIADYMERQFAGVRRSPR